MSNDDDREKYPSELAERFQIRLPPGLRDRIKAYAERHGRSMNTEIVRILEQHFPQPESMSARISELLEALRVLKGGATDENIETLANEFDDTIVGIISGRVRGIDENDRYRIRSLYEDWRSRMAEDARDWAGLDEEEEEQLGLTGTTAKFIDPVQDDK